MQRWLPLTLSHSWVINQNPPIKLEEYTRAFGFRLRSFQFVAMALSARCQCQLNPIPNRSTTCTPKVRQKLLHTRQRLAIRKCRGICQGDSQTNWSREIGNLAQLWNTSWFVKSRTPMSWAWIDRVKTGLLYFSRRWLVNRQSGYVFGVDKQPIYVRNTDADC